MENLENINYLVRKPTVDTQNPGLFLLIHGYGSNEEDLFSFKDDLPADCFVVCVRGIYGSDYGGYAWYSIDFINMEKFTNTDEAIQSKQKLTQFLRAFQAKENIQPERTFLGGFSQGAILSYAISLNHPELMNQVIILSGYPEISIIGEITEEKDFGKLHFYVSHGKADPVIPFEWALQGDVLLSELNIDHEFFDYQSGHGIIPQNYFSLMDWIGRRM